MAKGTQSPGRPLLPESVRQAGYREGVIDTLRELVKDPAGLLERAKAIVEQADAMVKTQAMANALRRRAATTPAEKSARTKRLQRQMRDEALAGEFATRIKAGETTETARAKLGIGDVRARRIRKIAVRMGWLQPQQRRGSKTT